jgi:hypothetical protein
MTPTLANYRGYYIQNTLGCDTQDMANNGWSSSTSPSASAGWNGCQVPDDNYTIVHKRKGFPAGSYQLIVKNYDDATRIIVNGVQVRNYTGYYGGDNNYQDDLGFFCLNANSTIEVTTTENTGLATFKLNVVLVNAIYAGTAWTGGVNPNNKSVEIQNDLNIDNDLTICSCTVKAGTIVTIPADKTLTIIEDIVVEDGGQIVIENNGALVQVNNDATYTGANSTFTMKRDTQPLFRLDYTYWSSPIKAVSGYKLVDLSPNTLATKFYVYSNAWVAINRNEVMIPGKGYIVRAPNNFPMQGAGVQPQIDNIIFKGQPNNGVITTPVTADQWNLIGNPYPSAVNMDIFYSNLQNQANLEGTIYLWTHNTDISLSGTSYIYNPNDYATYNLSGGTGTKAEADGNTSTPSGYLAAGQAFFVKGKTSGNATFNNAMRVQQGGQNNQFFKPTPVQPVENWQTTGKHRVWLNLTSAQNDFNQILVGYIENATNQKDWGYDGEVLSGTAVSLYSILGTDKLTIQGRALPFSNTDEVPLGYKTTLTGTLKISIDHVGGLLEGQAIYIKDNLTNVVHNLKDSDYSFTTVPGTFNDRFVLRYLPQENLNTNTPVIDENSIVVFNNNNQISITSSEQSIDKVEIYDLNGRLLFSKSNIKETKFTTQNFNVNAQVILVKITTDTKGELLKKVILN